MTSERLAIANSTPGWLTEEEGASLHRWALTTPGPYIELGSYCGKSTVWLGAAAETARTLLYTVDWHRGIPRMETHQDSLQRLWDTIRCAQLLDSVIPIVGTTAGVARYWATPVSFCFIDACHDEEVVRDVENWERHVTQVLAFHDNDIPHVAAAIRRAREHYGWRPIEAVGRLTVLTRGGSATSSQPSPGVPTNRQ